MSTRRLLAIRKVLILRANALALLRSEVRVLIVQLQDLLRR